MALINKLGQYIRLGENDSFEVYTSAEARQRFKVAPASTDILIKYKQVLQEFESPEFDEFRYYNSDEYDAQYQAWLQEYHTYFYNLVNYVFGQEYPLMSQYYPNVKDSIPEIVAAGTFGQQSLPVAEAYEAAKKYNNWGETTDA